MNSTGGWYRFVWLEKGDAGVFVVLQYIRSSFELLPQDFDAELVNHTTEVVRDIEWVLYAY